MFRQSHFAKLSSCTKRNTVYSMYRAYLLCYIKGMPQSPVYEPQTLLLQPGLQGYYRQILRDYPKSETAHLLQNDLHSLQDSNMKIGAYNQQKHLLYTPAVQQFYSSLKTSIAPLSQGLITGGFSK
ncbi:hypothetical protein P4V86_22680 [Brevibacillus laterosporus]|uniref:hypothetical protein n=2 Tax=Brevibacillus laterosporus TaxID=1465 RepID=UPI00112A48D6|nr:hypothetical protein [Brevibacillus laterosporus]MED2006134.1 hypothetical protein [Brevibacillus laterosporus]MED4761766.1 hypothetical protein [Brevibacillus laterosporus]